jgi:hypothetical protein
LICDLLIESAPGWGLAVSSGELAGFSQYLPLGLIACCWAELQWLEQFKGLRQFIIRLGAHSYRFF